MLKYQKVWFMCANYIHHYGKVQNDNNGYRNRFCYSRRYSYLEIHECEVFLTTSTSSSQPTQKYLCKWNITVHLKMDF